MKLPLSYYRSKDVITLAKDLIGCHLYTNIDDEVCSGIIIETEAYRGYDDKACHANNGKKTKRTLPMFQNGGITYIYLCYGIHHLLNIVTNKKNAADAVLIRAVKPLSGTNIMLKRQNKKKYAKNICNGPALLTKAFGINLTHNKKKLNGNTIWIEQKEGKVTENDILVSPRIGITYAKEDALLPWRFRLKPLLEGKKAK